ncbi:MAG: polysaccharide export protein [Chromatiaceae bacterium]|jgi:polysaccharide export outer membrane protein|nr:polysaccharide export protein [Chromatiaceae bacterium]
MLCRLLAVALLALGLQACSTSGGTPPEADTALADPGRTTQLPSPDLPGGVVPAVVGIPADPGAIASYRIGPYDLLQIQVFQVDELSRTERVSEDGYVVMPLIGGVQVGGLTQREAEKAIADKLAERYLQNPQVSIFVAEYASQKVTVIGQVKKPGVFPLAGRTTLMQAIALAGGFDDTAKKGEIVVFRKQSSGEVRAYVVDLAAVEEGRLTDPLIVGDDRVVVPKSGAAALGKAVGNVLTGWAIRVPLL